MKRLHIGMRVEDIAASVRFYSTLFCAAPTVQKDDYAKWMLDDPRVNFSVSTHCDTSSMIHLGIQVEDRAGLDEVAGRLKGAGVAVQETPEVTCCYAKSDKAWVADPDGIPWETFLTHGPSVVYGEEILTDEQVQALSSGSQGCCGSDAAAGAD